MDPPNLPAQSTNGLATPSQGGVASLLPSGRSVVLRTNGQTEEIEVRSPGGDMELRIALTAQGPVLTLRGARLEIDSTDAVAVSCRRFELHATEGVHLSAGGDVGIKSEAELRMQSAGDTLIDGDFVKLNCLDRQGYHDGAQNVNLPAQLPAAGDPGP